MNKITAQINFLRIYATPKDVVSTNGTKGQRGGAVVLYDPINGVSAIELSPKQLDNLASIAGIGATGIPAWRQLAVLTGTARSGAVLELEEHKKDDTYKAMVDGKEQELKYKTDWTRISVASIILNDAVSNKMVDSAISMISSNWGDFSFRNTATVDEGVPKETVV